MAMVLTINRKANSMFKIYGTYKGNRELIDQADTKSEADYLASEYRLAFGPEWLITIERS